MNKYLLLSAAALTATIAGASSAQAKHWSVQFADISGQAYCDGLDLHNNGPVYWGYHVYTTCGYSHNAAILGLVVRGTNNPRLGDKNLALSDDTWAFYFHNENYGILFDVSVPVVPYKPPRYNTMWESWVWFGTSPSAFLGNEGYLIEWGAPVRAERGHKPPSTISKLLSLIKARQSISAK